MTNPSWGTKRSCPSCNAHFYDLNKLPAECPKCHHSFDPGAVTKAKRKAVKREAPESRGVEHVPTVLANRKQASRKKDKEKDAEAAGEGISDIEITDGDDLENLKELSELEEREEPIPSGDDADDESIIEELDTGGKVLVEDIEEEELAEEAEEEDEDSPKLKKAQQKKKAK